MGELTELRLSSLSFSQVCVPFPFRRVFFASFTWVFLPEELE